MECEEFIDACSAPAALDGASGLRVVRVLEPPVVERARPVVADIGRATPVPASPGWRLAADVALAPGAVVYGGAVIGSGSSIGPGRRDPAGQPVGERGLVEDGVMLGKRPRLRGDRAPRGPRRPRARRRRDDLQRRRGLRRRRHRRAGRSWRPDPVRERAVMGVGSVWDGGRRWTSTPGGGGVSVQTLVYITAGRSLRTTSSWARECDDQRRHDGSARARDAAGGRDSAAGLPRRRGRCPHAGRRDRRGGVHRGRRGRRARRPRPRAWSWACRRGWCARWPTKICSSAGASRWCS